MKFKNELVKIGACQIAINWVGDRDIITAWKECDNINWMMWLADHCNIEKKYFVMIACACARTALQYVTKGEERPLRAIEAAEKWIKNPTEENRDAAYAAAYAANAAANAANAANAAAYAADAANAAYAAANAAYAANAANAAYAANAANAANAAGKKQMADIIRSIIPIELLEITK
jgi:hypothetical protein